MQHTSRGGTPPSDINADCLAVTVLRLQRWSSALCAGNLSAARSAWTIDCGRLQYAAAFDREVGFVENQGRR
eukprot:2305679-Pyramimonas_sp.AAC.1